MRQLSNGVGVRTKIEPSPNDKAIIKHDRGAGFLYSLNNFFFCLVYFYQVEKLNSYTLDLEGTPANITFIIVCNDKITFQKIRDQWF